MELSFQVNLARGKISGIESTATTPDFGVGLGDDSATKTIGGSINPTPERTVADLMKRMEEMQKAMEETQKATEAKTSKLEQVVEDERKKTEKMQKAMEAKTSKLERAVEDERKKTEKIEKVVEDEQKKTEKMEKAVEDERKKTSKLEEKSSWLERELDAVKETANDTSEWIMTGCLDDGEALRRIKLRTLLDRVQALLAFSVGVTPQPYTRNASGLWRDMLVGSTTPQRLASAEGLLDAGCSHSESTNSALIDFMHSGEAMEMAVELQSKFRERGGQAAHYNLTKPQYIAVIEEHCQKGGENGDGLKVFANFLFP